MKRLFLGVARVDDQAARVTYPFVRETTPTWPPRAEKPDAAAAPPSVLLVGREETLGSDLSETLRATPCALYGPIWPPRIQLQPLSGRAFDAAIVDVDAGDDAFDVVLQLAEAEKPCRCIVLSSQLDRATVRDAFLAGVVACLRKPVDRRVFEAALHRAIDATRVMRGCIDAADASMTVMASSNDAGVDLSVLTRREAEILALLTEGRSTRAMAEHLRVAERTVKFHVSNVLRKLGAASRISLLAKLRRRDAW